MRLVFLILLLLIIAKFSGQAQSTEFFKTYDFGSTTYPIFNSTIQFNNNIYVHGKIKSPNQKILIVKADENGLVLDSNIIGEDTVSYFPCNFIIVSDNNILIVGNFVDAITSDERQYMLFVDTNLVQTSDSAYANKLTYFWGNVKLNQNYYFGGATKYNNNGDSLTAYNVLFWKTDTNFNKTTSNSIGLENTLDGSYNITAGFDNNLLLGAITNKFNNQIDWYLVNADTTGQVLGEYYYGSPNKSDYDGIIAITQSSDSNYFLTGKFYMYDFGGGNFYYSAKVIKIDRLFNTIWTKQIGTTVKGVNVNKTVATIDGNQAILIQRNPVALPSTYYSQLTKFNNDGNVLWSRIYLQGDTTQYVRYRAWDLIETSDKGFAFCGSAFDTTNVGPNQEAWLVKTDSLGCDGLRSCNDTALVCQILQAPDTACKNNTAWLQVRFKGRSAPYFVYTNTTLALDSVYYPYTLPLWIDTLVSYLPTDTGMQQVIVKVQDPWGWNRSDTVQVYVKNCGANVMEETWYPKKVEIYPNPATSELHVKFRILLTEPATITMYDMQGKVVKQITTKNNETVIGISDLEQGVYGIRVIGNNINASERFVKW